MSLNIEHQEDKELFSVNVDGHQAYIDYHLNGGVICITHTMVPEEIGGRGIAGELTRFALDAARAKAWKVIPACSYTQAYLKRHPEYDDLRA